ARCASTAPAGSATATRRGPLGACRVRLRGPAPSTPTAPPAQTTTTRTDRPHEDPPRQPLRDRHHRRRSGHRRLPHRVRRRRAGGTRAAPRGLLRGRPAWGRWRTPHRADRAAPAGPPGPAAVHRHVPARALPVGLRPEVPAARLRPPLTACPGGWPRPNAPAATRAPHPQRRARTPAPRPTPHEG